MITTYHYLRFTINPLKEDVSGILQTLSVTVATSYRHNHLTQHAARHAFAQSQRASLQYSKILTVN